MGNIGSERVTGVGGGSEVCVCVCVCVGGGGGGGVSTFVENGIGFV